MKIKLQNPCSVLWESMQDDPDGKFCDKCSKCVVDFTNKTEEQIEHILKKENGNEICGRITIKSLSAAAAGIVLMTNLTFAQAQTKDNFGSTTEQKITNTTKISGKIVHKTKKKAIANAEIIFVSKKQYLKTFSTENGEFSLEIPTAILEKNNLLSINFNEINSQIRNNPERKPPIVIDDDLFENTTIFFSKNDNIRDKEFQIESKRIYIGGIAIMVESPPDYYYFNGKSISERKFENLRKEHPEYQFFIFSGKEAEVVANKSYINVVSLLFSN